MTKARERRRPVGRPRGSTAAKGKVLTDEKGDLFRQKGTKRVYLSEKETELHLNGRRGKGSAAKDAEEILVLLEEVLTLLDRKVALAVEEDDEDEGQHPLVKLRDGLAAIRHGRKPDAIIGIMDVASALSDAF